MGKTKTIGEALDELRELEGKAAVINACISYLKTRYVGRDSSMPIAQIQHPDGSAVPSAIVEMVCNAWEDDVRDMEETAAAYRGEVLNG